MKERADKIISFKLDRKFSMNWITGKLTKYEVQHVKKIWVSSGELKRSKKIACQQKTDNMSCLWVKPNSESHFSRLIVPNCKHS